MNEALIYLGIALSSVVLFYLWYKRQGLAAEKQWLLKQIKLTSGQQQKPYVDALSQLKSNSASLSVTIWMALMIIPASFAIDYIWFQDIPIEQRVSVADLQNESNQAPDFATAIQQLEQKITENPNDLEGQLLYGRSMMSMQQYGKAVNAYQKANQLDPNNANILTSLAEAIAFNNNTGSFLGEPEQYLSQAIAINPQHQKAMWLQGIVYFENLDYVNAESIWTALLKQVDNPNIKSTITQQINQARQAQSKPPFDPGTQPGTADPGTSAENYLVVVDASEAVKIMTLTPEARIFIYAKQVNGPPMPIAAAPIAQPFNWPMSVRLGDSNSLNPERQLSSFSEVEFSAKLSLSGNATPAADDIKSEVKVGSKQNKSIQLTLTN